MQSTLFEQANLEVQASQRFALQNPQMLRAHLEGSGFVVVHPSEWTPAQGGSGSGGGGGFNLGGLLDG